MKALEMHASAQHVLAIYGVKGGRLERVVNAWNEPHRFYHTMEHLNHLVSIIESEPIRSTLNMTERQLLILAAVYHDVVYAIGAADNEDLSALECDAAIHDRYIHMPDRDRLRAMIMATKDHTVYQPDSLVRLFAQLDLYPLTRFDKKQMARYEHQIFREFQQYPTPAYIQGRIAVLTGFKAWMASEENDTANVDWLIDYVRNRTYRIGVYAGSFAPFHAGHLDVLLQAERQCDKVVVGVGRNPAKVSENTVANVEALRKYLNGREVIQYSAMLTDFAAALADSNEDFDIRVTIYRGLRDGDDLAFEMKQLRYMQELAQEDNINVAFIVGDSKYGHISSSGIKQVMATSKTSAERYLLYDYKL